MTLFLTIFIHELKIMGKNLSAIFANLAFFLISVAVFALLSQNQEIQGSNLFYSTIIIWFSLLFSLIFSSSEFLKKDFDDGTIEQILTSIDNFEIFILAKSIANLVVNFLPLLLSSLIISHLMAFETEVINKIIILILLSGIAINFICCFCGSLSVIGNSAPMIALIAMPLIIPILLISFSGIINDFTTSCKILCGIAVFSGCVTIFVTAKIIKIAAE